MSPTSYQTTQDSSCFPRVSGDEPIKASDDARKASFSPRERG